MVTKEELKKQIEIKKKENKTVNSDYPKDEYTRLIYTKASGGAAILLFLGLIALASFSTFFIEMPEDLKSWIRVIATTLFVTYIILFIILRKWLEKRKIPL